MVNNVIFKKDAFALCKVPVPKGYPQSQTHSGIALHSGKLYLTTSPFPNVKYPQLLAYARIVIRKLSLGLICKGIIGEKYENPLLLIGDNTNVDPPTDFALMQSKPLMDTPDPYYGFPAFNSDPDIFIEDNKINIINRSIFRTKICSGAILNKYVIRLYLITGSIDCSRFKFERNILFKEFDDKISISPCLTRYEDSYRLFRIETSSYLDGKSFDGIYVQSSQTIDGFMNNEEWIKIQVEEGDFLPWHMSVFSYEGHLYTIIACVRKGVRGRCWQMLGEFSRDLSTMHIYQTPLTDYKSYRGSAVVREDGEFILYNTTVHEKIKGGKSVDGREVIMAHMPFEKLLAELKEPNRACK